MKQYKTPHFTLLELENDVILASVGNDEFIVDDNGIWETGGGLK